MVDRFTTGRLEKEKMRLGKQKVLVALVAVLPVLALLSGVALAMLHNSIL